MPLPHGEGSCTQNINCKDGRSSGNGKEDDQVHVLPERNKPEETRKEHGCS